MVDTHGNTFIIGVDEQQKEVFRIFISEKTAESRSASADVVRKESIMGNITNLFSQSRINGSVSTDSHLGTHSRNESYLSTGDGLLKRFDS